MGTAILSLTHVVVFFVLILFNARLLRKTELERAESVAEASRLSREVQRRLLERNEARLSVTQGQEQLAELIGSASDAIISADESGRITLFNPAAQKMFGLSEAEALGKPLGEFIEIKEQAPSSNAQIVSAVDARGIRIQLDASVSRSQSSRGETSTFILRDVTERRRAERLARESEERLHTVIESLTEGLIIADLDGQILHWNKAALRMHGFETLEECLLKVADFQKSFELSAPDGRVLSLAEWPLPKVIAGEVLTDYEVRVRRFDSDWLQVFNYGGRIFTEPNGRRLAFVTVTDITERKRSEESLREQSGILDLAPVMIRDLEGRILFWNTGSEKMYQWSPEDALDKVSHELLQTQFPRSFEEISAQLLDQGHWEGELIHFRKDGVRLVIASQWVLHKDPYGNPKAVLEVNNDITERKLAEEEIKTLNEELERRVTERTAQLQAANRELEAFSYSVSHDLRAPLRHINGFSTALIEDYEDKLDVVGKGYLNELREASQEMAHLIDDVLQLARLTRSEMHRESVDLSELAKGVLDELQKIDTERTVDIHIQSDLAVQCDRRLMRVVLANLLGNAWKFTSQRPQAEVSFGQAQENGERVYYVRDNGAGFDMAFASKLFRAFQRLHTAKEFEGTGIGLATVQRIINRHGGRVWAEGKPNEGATFYFALPNRGETGDEGQSDFSS
jgi:PAS domain S-box-containing protein